MKRDMRDWAREIIASGERRAFPLMTCVGLQLTGLRVIDVVKDGKKQADCIRALASRYPSAAAITAMDLSVEAEAFGSSIRFTDNETPTVTGSLVTDAGAEALAVPPVGSGRTGVYLEAVALSAAGMTDRPVFGCLIGPFSLAGRLCGMTEALMNIHMNPGALRAVLGKCADFLSRYARAFRDTGADGIAIAEPAAGLISPGAVRRFLLVFRETDNRGSAGRALHGGPAQLRQHQASRRVNGVDRRHGAALWKRRRYGRCPSPGAGRRSRVRQSGPGARSKRWDGGRGQGGGARAPPQDGGVRELRAFLGL